MMMDLDPFDMMTMDLFGLNPFNADMLCFENVKYDKYLQRNENIMWSGLDNDVLDDIIHNADRTNHHDYSLRIKGLSDVVDDNNDGLEWNQCSLTATIQSSPLSSDNSNSSTDVNLPTNINNNNNSSSSKNSSASFTPHHLNTNSNSNCSSSSTVSAASSTTSQQQYAAATASLLRGSNQHINSSSPIKISNSSSNSNSSYCSSSSSSSNFRSSRHSDIINSSNDNCVASCSTSSSHSASSSSSKSCSSSHSINKVQQYPQRRKEHNKSEKKRRDHLRNAFNNLRDQIPKLKSSEKKAARVTILKESTSYVSLLSDKHRYLEQTKKAELVKKEALLKKLKLLQKATGQPECVL